MIMEVLGIRVHIHTQGGSGSQGGAWVTSGYLADVNNLITITNDSNFPLEADLSYTPGTTSLNANPSAAKSVIGIFGNANTDFTANDILNEGEGGAHTATMKRAHAVLEMDHHNITANGTFYYYRDSSSGSNVANKYFALSGVPDAGLNTTFNSMTTVGKIKVSLKPATGVTKVTN